MDRTEKNGALILRALRDSDQKVISGMPCPTRCDAKLIRLSRGKIRLLLTDSTPFARGKALYGDLPIHIVHQADRLIEIEQPCGTLALRATLTQSHYYTEQIDKLSAAFFTFWNPMWQRDSTLEASSSAPWESTLREVLDQVPAQPPISLQWDDPETVHLTISRMKSHKAPGVDGWRAQELKMLPWSAISHLANIFSSIWPTQFTPEQVLARTILLAKIPLPETFSDGRPITILGYIPRLASKMIADQLLHSWGQSWDPRIAGGLPFRAVKDITIQQQYMLEKAHLTHTPYGAFTLDLVKAFNLIPRQIASSLLIHFGASGEAIGFWIRSLNNMGRFLQIRQACGTPSLSTTGAPEGDALSVCAMLVIAAAFFHKMSSIQVQPCTYADNWTFMSTSQRALFRAMVATLNFTTALRMKVDIQKSWGWGTDLSMRTFWSQMNVLFPAGNIEIEVKQSSKDLGCMMHYTRRVTLGYLKTRMASAATRLYRLSKLHLTIPEKAAKIQAAIWPVAFYGAESQVIGDSHFVKLRRLACDALVGKHKFASSWIALHFLTDRVSDPLLYVILTAACSFRRLFFYHNVLAQDMWSSILTSSSAKGPCGALAAYLRKVNWIPLPGGSIETP